MKKLLSLSLAVLLVVALVLTSGCAKKEEQYKAADISVACMTGPTGVGMAKLMADSDAKLTANNYTFTVAGDATGINEKFVKGEINIASVPTNVAATLYNKTNGKVRILAVNTYGVLSILAKDSGIDSIDDLKGKTVYSTGKGQNPEFIFKYILEKNGINPETDLTINYVSGTDLVAKLVSGEADIALAPEPAATTVLVKNKELNRVLSINDEWSKVSDTTLMMGCVIALDSYIAENEAAVEKFLEEYKASIEFAKTDVDNAAKHCATYKITASEAIAKKAIPTCNLCYVTGKDMKTNVNGYLNVLFTADKKAVGGAMPADDFYYKAD